MKWISLWLLRVAIFILAFVGIRTNLHTVDFFLGAAHLQLPLSILLVFTLLLGFVVGFVSNFKSAKNT
jgi:uncharacterized integral membrane protein